MGKETSARVSSLAADILKEDRAPPEIITVSATRYNNLLDKAKTLAGSAMSQDETPGQNDTSGIHPPPVGFSEAQIAADQMLHFFHYAHLPAALQATSRMFFNLAYFVVNTLPRNPERTVSLRKLLEAKDAAVRANLPAPKPADKPPVASPRADGDVAEIGGHDEDRDGPIPFKG